MDTLVGLLLSFPPEKQLASTDYAKAAAAHMKQLSSIPEATWKQSMRDGEIFETLQGSTNSIGYLYALQYYISQVSGNAEGVDQALQYCIAFFQRYDPVQMRYVGTKWKELYEWTAEALLVLKRKDVAFMGDGLLRIDATTSLFTTCHLLYIRLCLRGQVPSLACLILDKDISTYTRTVDKQAAEVISDGDSPGHGVGDNSGQILAEHILEYYLLGAQVYLGLSNWQRARLFLEYILLHPSINHATSSFQIEAYKKWILIGLLTRGETLPFLSTIDHIILKNVRAASKPYDVLAETVKSRDWRRLQAEIDAGVQLWTDDGNARLVQATSDAMLTFCVADMRKTYAAVPVSAVAKHLKLDTQYTVTMLQRMIIQRRLRASLIKSDDSTIAALQFHQGYSQDLATEVQSIAARTTRIEGLVQAIQDADRKLQLTKEYLDITHRSKRQNAENDPADQMDLEWSSPSMPTNMPEDDGDEDIMA